MYFFKRCIPQRSFSVYCNTMKHENTRQCLAVIKRLKGCFKSIIKSTHNKPLKGYTHNILKHLILQMKIIFKLRVYFFFFIRPKT